MKGFNWKIVGHAGEGVKVAGMIFSQTCLKQGFYVHGYTEYPSLIRGGDNTYQVHFSPQPHLTVKKTIDVLVALNKESFDCHHKEASKHSMVIYDGEQNDENILNIPLAQLVKKIAGPAQVKNIIAVGASCFLLGLDVEILKRVITKTFAGKGKQVIEINKKAALIGYQFAKEKWSQKRFADFKPIERKSKSILLTGNEAIGLGAVAGGLKLFVAYPMTPATSILHFLAKNAKEAKIAVRQGEDEIGVVNMAIGAGYAGIRTMVATSGGGFSLMTEGLGLAGVTETPLVIINAMRPGPASGMPTWTGQGDLLYTIYASQDEFPRIVVAPGDPEEAFELTKLALTLAEKYQMPVIIITDKHLSESLFTVNKFKSDHLHHRYGFANTKDKNIDQPFARYQLTSSGVSPRTIPGQKGGIHLANSYEHDQFGYATEVAQIRTDQVDKRAKKTAAIYQDPGFVKPIIFGPPEATTTLVSWGSNKGAILQVIGEVNDTNFIHLPWLWPFPAEDFKKAVAKSKKIVTLECNSTGQLNQLIYQQTGIKIDRRILKYDGRPFFPSEIISQLNNLK